jgi:hypothetical protein
MPAVTPLTAEEIAKLRRLLDDGELTLSAEAADAFPRLLDEVERSRIDPTRILTTEEVASVTPFIQRTRALLRRIEWGSEGESSCPACGGEEPVFDEEKELDAGSWQPRPYYTPAGHRPGCELAALLGGEDSGPTSEELGLRAYDLEYPGKPRGGEG